MSQPLVCPDGSFERLQADGIKFVLHDNRIIVAVPYLNKDGELRRGYFSDALNFLDAITVTLNQSSHQLHFAGEEPFRVDGTSLLDLLNRIEQVVPVYGGLESKHHLSTKRKDANGNLLEHESIYQKIRLYYDIVAGPAYAKYGELARAAIDIDLEEEQDSPFLFPDAHSAVNGLSNLNKPFLPQTVAIIGLGGTGSYILDFISKAPVAKIKIFGGDKFEVKNSFRSPGATLAEDFRRGKATLYAERYGRFHNGIKPFDYHLTPEVIGEVEDCDFIFLCIDRNSTRRVLSQLLDERRKDYIDVGLGLERSDLGLYGQCRTTLVVEETRERINNSVVIPHGDVNQEEYTSNIQIAEFNALNAALAVMRYKSRFGFYRDVEPIFNLLYATDTSSTYKQRL